MLRMLMKLGSFHQFSGENNPRIILEKPTRWAPTTNDKWSCNPYKWPYKWATGVITLTLPVGGFNLFEKYGRQIRSIPQVHMDENKKSLKPPPSLLITGFFRPHLAP